MNAYGIWFDNGLTSCVVFVATFQRFKWDKENTMRFQGMWLALMMVMSLCCLAEARQTQAVSAETEDEIAEGHSYHGEVYNEGPRQAAYLMDGLGRSNFKVSTDQPQAQAFFNQGIDQLHGFWYFEAERSFRQVVVLDPDCAMAYWGLAMANVNNEDRAKDFITQAVEKMTGASAEDRAEGKADDDQDSPDSRPTTRREKLYIDSLAAFYDPNVKDVKKRAAKLVDKLEELVLEFPDDIQAKAFLAVQIWMNRDKGLPITSHVAVNALLDQVFEADPMHPAHHYRIHLWDRKDAKRALQSAADCGPSLPNIAHMWHMPGHIYSKLKRYDDAVWQQEASARVDHRNMMHDQILPDQIHNFAHNNEWCVRNLNHVGRVRDAIDLATNMISMPRHPEYNQLDKRGSAFYGRQRLFDTLDRYELWPDLIQACMTSTLEPTDNKLESVKRLRYLGRAYFRSGKVDKGAAILEQLNQQFADLNAEMADKTDIVAKQQQEKTQELRDVAENLLAMLPGDFRSDFEKRLRSRIRRDHRDRTNKESRKELKDLERQKNVLRRAIDEMTGYQLVESGEYKAAAKKLKKAGEVDPIFRASVALQQTFDDPDQRKKHVEAVLKEARKFVDTRENEVQPLAALSRLLWDLDRKAEAVEYFQKMRAISASIDMQSPVFQPLNQVAQHAGIDGDWRIEPMLADDLGDRPDLESLGPFRWQPVTAREWQLVDSAGDTISSKQFQGQPVIVIFYLGHGCLHCAEQLQAFAPKLEEFKAAGIEMVAISTDQREDLKKSIESYGDQPLPIQLLANPGMDVFKAFRAFDEFENQPLHGTFLIDGDGKIRWQDISYEPFMDPEFLLKESVRLLSQGGS